MTRRDALILRVATIWTVFVWVTFVWNLAGSDEDAGFVAVHVLLAVVSVGFGVAIWGVATRGRREAKERARNE